MPTDNAKKNTPKGIASPILLLVVLVVVGVGVAVFAGSKNLIGMVLGAKTRSEDNYRYQTTGIKVTVISPKSPWNLSQYLCKTKERCEESATGEKWWATVSGAPTTEDGHEVFIEKAEGWSGFGFVKLGVKSVRGESYQLQGSQKSYAVVDILAPITSLTFREPDAGNN